MEGRVEIFKYMQRSQRKIMFFHLSQHPCPTSHLPYPKEQFTIFLLDYSSNLQMVTIYYEPSIV